mgnify:CR=1 FL=1
MTCEMEFNQRGLQIPSEILAALALSDITLEAHMCRHLIMLMPKAVSYTHLTLPTICSLGADRRTGGDAGGL